MCQVTKEKMIGEIQEKIRRLQEDSVISRLSHGELCCVQTKQKLLVEDDILHFIESNTRKRKSRASKFQLPEKRKKPVVVNDIPSIIIIICVLFWHVVQVLVHSHIP